MYPPTASTKQILILKYLTPMGEYQEFLSHAFEQNALGLILSYVNVKEHGDVRLAFEALKYLSALLCHKKFSIEFIHAGGLQVNINFYGTMKIHKSEKINFIVEYQVLIIQLNDY